MIGPEEAVADTMRDRRRNGMTLLVIALILAFTLGATWRIDHRADKSDAVVHNQGQEIQSLSSQVQINGQLAEGAKLSAEEANRRLKAAGEPTVPIPTATPVTPPTTGPGLSIDEVRAVVTAELATHKVTITQAEISQIARVAAQMVPKPEDGKTPTAAQIQPVVTAAIAAYCTGDKCVGKVGQVGPKGEPGKDAPKVTDEELLTAAEQALAAYCGQESSPCAGKVGPSGTDGQDAPVMVDMDCLGDGDASYWRMQFNKGPDETAKGPCRIGPEPPS